MTRIIFALFLVTGTAYSATDPFAEFVRKSEFLTPEQEAKTFHLPPGFEIQLFAAEPDITKPMNMAFDERGRLWITESREYPFAAPLEKKGRDTIKILEDTDGDGRADRITTFADGLNIPIGLHPYRGGVIAWSIPNIWHFQDTDGDGKADKREPLFGPLGWEKDTHGMNASFRRGFDGWLYITHGFNNTSVVKGRDGSEIKLNSGNTYRVRPDGSRVEPYAWGQVNPFGLSLDPLGNIYSADCHSSPIYQLLRGAYYPSFGKPDDGLGFAPTLMQHSHNSTAIGGIAYYGDNQWPTEFRDNIFVGNVMTSRINRDSIRFIGSSPNAKEMPDFLTSDDPWFRPCDLQLGPDGALYVADFYNRIIGHYEVPLTHPGRDRERGRIWRIVYLGNRGQLRPFNLTGLSVSQVITELASPNITRRMLAMNYLVDTIGRTAIEPVRRTFGSSSDAFTRSHSLWILHRLNALDEQSLARAATDRDRGVRVHAMRVLSETPDWSVKHRQLALSGLPDADAHVQRAAADALGQHPVVEHIRPLIDFQHRINKADNHLLHVVRMSLRNQLAREGAFASLKNLSEPDSSAVADVAVAVPSEHAGGFLLNHVQRYSEPTPVVGKYLRHAARYLPVEGVDLLAQLAQEKFPGDVDGQLVVFKSVQEGMAQRGAKLGPASMTWGRSLAASLLKVTTEPSDWHNTPIEGMRDTKNPWFVQRRVSADGNNNARFLCSLPPGGEHLTGVLRSKTFALPEQLTFYVAGHDGPPSNKPQGKNVVRLRAADSNEVLTEHAPPRNDTAQKVTWNLSAHRGKSAYLEVVDSDTGSGYAWLAVGRFEPSVIQIPRTDLNEVARRQQAGADLARTLGLNELEPELVRLLREPDAETQAAAGRTIASFHSNEDLSALASLLAEPIVPAPTRARIAETLAQSRDSAAVRTALTDAMRTSARRVQMKLAQALAGGPKGSETLLALVHDRIAPAALLQERAIKDKLVAANSSLKTRVEELTKDLAPPNEAIQKLIDDRRKTFDGTKARIAEGARLYAKNCAACHQLEGQGALIGPQLDGIGNRGLERLTEDLLDPSRAVDHAFRSTVVVLNDGDVVSGLLRREEGETLILADSTGKEISLSKKQITDRRETETSLMPENFGELLTVEEFNDLMAFLLSKNSSPTKTAKSQ